MIAYSKYQLAIFDFATSQTSNLMVDAKAGSGKSFTITELTKRLPNNLRILMMAFNKDIADSLKPKVPFNVTVSTYNSFGNGIVYRAFGRTKLDTWKTYNKLKMIVSDADAKKLRMSVNKIVGLIKADAIVGNITSDWLNLTLDKHDIQIPKGVKYESFFEIVCRTFKGCVDDKRLIDFDDQIYYPIFYNLDVPKYDLLLVDEVQDTNRVQLELIKRAGTRIIAVGDPHQAIYGFRGADADAMNNMKAELNMTILPLSICYRCSKSVVNYAKEIVPEIEASPEAVEGSIKEIKYQDFESAIADGDYVLCRCTAPLVSSCMGLIRKGRKALIRGRDIAEGLISMLDTFGVPSTPIEQANAALQSYRNKELDRLQKLERDTLNLEDKLDTLQVLFESCDTLGDVRQRIESIFSKVDSEGVTFMTVHKAKGLERKNVFLLDPSLMPHPKAKKPWQQVQEQNLIYVARTRALENFIEVIKS